MNHTRCIFTERLLYTGLFLFACIGTLHATPSDSVQQAFFSDLESELRADYLLCTGDSSELSLEDLFAWRKEIENAIANVDFPQTVRKFSEETGIAPASARPCEIVAWMQRIQSDIEQSSRLLSENRDYLLRQRNDSLLLAHELAAVSSRQYDCSGIPFGLSKKGAMILMQRDKKLAVIDDGSILRIDSLTVGNMVFRAAFHFTKNDTYWCYELESVTCSLDSLDVTARPIVEFLSTCLEKKTSRPADHIYRVGMLDIVPGRLSICRLWNFDDATAYTGLARDKNRFYAKMIVKSR